MGKSKKQSAIDELKQKYHERDIKTSKSDVKFTEVEMEGEPYSFLITESGRVIVAQDMNQLIRRESGKTIRRRTFPCKF
ncbi:hypothetical protein JW824_08945 [bacterium]|nr:hypothetical protein [bacterium]